MSPKASIVVISWNRLADMRRLVGQLLDQSYPRDRYELIVVDDGSSDGSREWLTSLDPQDVITVFGNSNRGRSASRNAGIQAARGEIVIMVDGDHTVDRDFVAIHVERHERERCVIVGLSLFPDMEDMRALNTYLNGCGAIKLPKGARVPGRYFLTRNCSVPRDLLFQAGLFDEDFVAWGGEDVDVGVRLEATGVPMYGEPRCLAIHHHVRPLADLLGNIYIFGRDCMPILVQRHPKLFVEMNLDRALRNPFGPQRFGPLTRLAWRCAMSAPVYNSAKLLASSLRRHKLPRVLFDYLHLRQYTWGFRAHARATAGRPATSSTANTGDGSEDPGARTRPRARQGNAEASGALPTVAHVVDPFLFLTGSWIHTQIDRNKEFRHVVLCQRRENSEVFPHEPVYEALQGRGWFFAARSEFARRILGRHLLEPYRGWIARERAVLLHAHFGWEGCRALALRRATDLPLVTTFYGLDVPHEARRLHWRGRYARLFREGERFFVEGSHLAQEAERVGCPRERIRVMPLGVDLERIQFHARAAAPEGAVRILFSGSFRDKKGVPDAVLAFARILGEFPLARLVLLGDGPKKAEIEDCIRRSGCGASVEMRGYVDYPEYLDELARAHLLIAPSRVSETGDTEGGAPVTLIEAQASGLPIVTTRHCDIPEVTVPGESALLAEERDVPALAAHLRALLRTPDSWAWRGAVGRRHMESRHSARGQAEKIAAEYREILTEAGNRAAAPRLCRSS